MINTFKEYNEAIDSIQNKVDELYSDKATICTEIQLQNEIIKVLNFIFNGEK